MIHPLSIEELNTGAQSKTPESGAGDSGYQ